MTKPLTTEQKERRQKFRRRMRIEAHFIRIRVQVRRMLKARKAREEQEMIVECGKYGLTGVIGISSTAQLHDVYGPQGARK